MATATPLPRPLSIDQRHQSHDKSFTENTLGGGHQGSEPYGHQKGANRMVDQLSWFPFPGQHTSESNKMDTTPRDSSQENRATTAQTQPRDRETVGSGPQAYAGTFHGLGSIPLGADYGSGSSSTPSTGMDALSEAAAARSAEARRLSETKSGSDRGEIRTWAEEYRNSEPERRGTGFWKTKPKEEPSPGGRRRDDVEKDINDLRGHVHELIHMMRPFASRSPHHDPAPPPLYLQSHFHRMSKIIHSSLVSIAPHVSPHLAGFSFAPVEQRTDAEREMEVIRKRRDMLISRAAQAKLHSHTSHSSPRLDIEMGMSRSRSGPSSRSRTRSRSRSPSPRSFRSAVSRSNSASPRRHAAIIEYTRDEYAARPRVADEYASRPRDPRDGTPLGRCHGCGSGALHWRRGPDGPKSLCDSCGLHYAKLSRSSASPRSYTQPFTSHRIPEIKGRT